MNAAQVCNLSQLLRQTAALYPDRPGLIQGEQQWTWGEIDAGVNARVTKTLSLTGSIFYDHSIDGGATWSLGGRIGHGRHRRCLALAGIEMFHVKHSSRPYPPARARTTSV